MPAQAFYVQPMISDITIITDYSYVVSIHKRQPSISDTQ